MAALTNVPDGIVVTGGGTIGTTTAPWRAARADVGRNTGKWKFRATMLYPEELGLRSWTGFGFASAALPLVWPVGKIPGGSEGGGDSSQTAIMHSPLGSFVWYEAHYISRGGWTQSLINYLRATSITFAIDCDLKRYWFCCETLTGDGAPYNSGWLYPNIGVPAADPTFATGYDYSGDIVGDTIYPFIFSDIVGGSVQLDFAPSGSDGCLAPDFQDWDTAVAPASSDDTHVFA